MIHFVLHDAARHASRVVVVEGVKAGPGDDRLDHGRGPDDRSSTAQQDIPIGHKVALKDMAPGDTVIKYGIDIGKVVAPIQRRASTPTSTTSRPSAGSAADRDMAVIFKNTTFLGYRRENGRVGVRNHVIILPVDDLSNAAAEAVANNIKGALAIPHPYGRLQFGADLDLHFRTLIGAGCNPNVAAVVVIGIEDRWTKKRRRRHRRDRQAGGRLRHRAARRPRHDHARVEGGASEYVQWASEKQREDCPIAELWVSTKCGESDTTSGCGANPDRRQRVRQAATRSALTLCFGETTELTGGEQIVAGALRATTRCASSFMFMFDRYQEVIDRHKTERPLRFAADQGQHRRRPDDDRGEGARQHPEDRQEVHGRRRARQGRDADAPGPVVHGLVVARRPRWSRSARRRASRSTSSRPARAT